MYPEGRDPYDDPYAADDDAEEAREQMWARFEGECRDFARSEPDGFAAVLRAVARAMKDQPGEAR